QPGIRRGRGRIFLPLLSTPSVVSLTPRGHPKKSRQDQAGGRNDEGAPGRLGKHSLGPATPTHTLLPGASRRAAGKKYKGSGRSGHRPAPPRGWAAAEPARRPYRRYPRERSCRAVSSSRGLVSDGMVDLFRPRWWVT